MVIEHPWLVGGGRRGGGAVGIFEIFINNLNGIGYFNHGTKVGYWLTQAHVTISQHPSTYHGNLPT